jgi:hypothetical protein
VGQVAVDTCGNTLSELHSSNVVRIRQYFGKTDAKQAAQTFNKTS